jgi:hypothetical protein
MKKYLVIGLLFLCTQVNAATPSRSYTYSAGSTILSSEVNADFNSLYNYLTTGVDTIKDGVIVNADIAPAAAISASKVDLSSITSPTYITQTANSTLSAEQALGDLATGIVKNTTTTGVLSIAANGTDYIQPSSVITNFSQDMSDNNYESSATPLTTDGAWHDLNISSKVGAGRRLVNIAGYVLDDAANNAFMIRTNGNSNEYTVLEAVTQAANITNYYEGWVLTDANGIIEYKAANTTWTGIAIRIKGWIVLN